MKTLANVFDNNKKWAKKTTEVNPMFFKELAKIQRPNYLWIGCSDSRVPANDIMGLKPGEVFVHRNIANMVIHTDFNFLSVLQYAVDVLNLEHVIVCGHYGCGGITAAVENKNHGLIDNWLRHIKDVYRIYETELDSIVSQEDRINRLCELNIVEQVKNICNTTIVEDAWSRGQKLSIHGWIYNLEDGILRDMDVTKSEL
jgi:carbonic anhydrase